MEPLQTCARDMGAAILPSLAFLLFLQLPRGADPSWPELPSGHMVTSSSSGAPGAICCNQINLNGSKSLLLTEGWVAMLPCNSTIPMPCLLVFSSPSS